MVLGEGMVFLSLLALGIYLLYRSIQHQIGLARMQKNFLLSVTHELKTPVAASKLFLQTLIRHDFGREKTSELLNKAIGENDRLSLLIDKVILAATLDSHQIPLSFTNQSLTGISSNICNTVAETIGLGHNWEIEITENVMLYCDGESIRSIWQNLLENALKYSPKGSLIRASLSKHGNKIEIKVSDEGIGINKTDVPYIFDKFFRSGNEETRSAKGTGLGLFIVKHLVSLHKGIIHYKNNHPQGSTFVVEFNTKTS